MTNLIKQFCDRIGFISDKTKAESGYSFDDKERAVNSVKITYLDEYNHNDRWEAPDKIRYKKRIAKEKEDYRRFIEEHQNSFEAKRVTQRDFRKNNAKVEI